MVALPLGKTIIDRAFTTTGVDFARPFVIKSLTSRVWKITKGYICVLVFLYQDHTSRSSKRFVHSQFLTGFSSICCTSRLSSLDIFRQWYEFCGCFRWNFRDFIRNTCESFRNVFANQCLNWNFISAGAAHMDGLWDAGVKVSSNTSEDKIEKFGLYWRNWQPFWPE